MKKLLSLIPIVGLMLVLAGFTDLPENHWANGAVQTLVNEGTVSGYPDGTFRPDAPVTRSQFVKMLGYRLPEPRKDYIVDLTRLHWAYDNLRYSPLRLIDGRLRADDPITREQVALYVYDCYGNGEEGLAPSVITKETNYPTEVGWVYDHGIMTGSDGLDLRLDEGLTRAEAAALIVKTRNAGIYDFAGNISGDMLERVFNSSALFDVEYDPDAVLTNGEVARAAYRLMLDRVDALWYDEEADFEHPYANDLKALEFILGDGRISAAFADAPAQPEDALAMLGYGAAAKIHTVLGYGSAGDYYRDARPADKALEAPLTWMYVNGIRPYGGGRLNSGTPVTHRMIAATLLQLDMLWGLQTSVTVDGGNVIYNDEPMRLVDLPANANGFQSVPLSVPEAIAGLPFYSAAGEEIEPGLPPSVNYPFCNDLRGAFVTYFSGESARLGESGAAVKFTYYPQLVYDSGEGMTVRVKAETVGDPGELFSGLVWHTGPESGVYWVEYPLSYTFMLE